MYYAQNPVSCNYMCIVSVEKVAQSVGCSPRVFAALFRPQIQILMIFVLHIYIVKMNYNR